MPYRDRFRLILNDLGAALAARGQDLGEVIDRANPALRETDRVLNILAQQSRQLSSLAENGDAALEPLARNRTSITGFMRNAAIAADATAERGDDLEEALSKFPETLHQVRLTMRELKDFADQGRRCSPTSRSPAPTSAGRPRSSLLFAHAGGPALTDAGRRRRVRRARSSPPPTPLLTDLASAATPPSRSATTSPPVRHLHQDRGFQSLADFIYYTSAATNGFDSFGHFLRINVQVTNCIDVSSFVVQGCEAFFQNHSAPRGRRRRRRAEGEEPRPSSAAASVPPAPQPPAAA